MGSRTPSPNQTAEELVDIGPDDVVADCPLQRKGALRFVVSRRGSDQMVQSARITIAGAANDQGDTGANGVVDFTDLPQGSYTVYAAYEPSGLVMLQEVDWNGATSVVGGKRRVIPLEVVQLGELKIEVRKDDNGAPGELLDDANVVAIRAGGKEKLGAAVAGPERAPAGDVDVTVEVKAPLWRLLEQPMTATVEAGETTVFPVRAEEMTWLKVQIRDVDDPQTHQEAWIDGAIAQVEVEGEKVFRVTHGDDDPNHPVKKGAQPFKLDWAQTPDGDGDEDVHLFEELA